MNTKPAMLFALGLALLLQGCDTQQPSQTSPQRLSSQEIAEWNKIGATEGWCGIMKDGRLQHTTESSIFKDTGYHKPQIGWIPEVSLSWKYGTRKELPVTETEFGISFSFSEFNDRSLWDLKNLTSLISLNLCKTHVTDTGMKEIVKHKKLHTLNLALNFITDKSMSELSTMEQLRYLDLGATKITDKGVHDLAGLKHLKYLSLGANKITDQSVTSIALLNEIESLDIVDTDITDDGISELAKLNKLSILKLGGTKITDSAVRYLARIKTLKYLDISGTKITFYGRKELQQALPNCDIK